MGTAEAHIRFRIRSPVLAGKIGVGVAVFCGSRLPLYGFVLNAMRRCRRSEEQ
ncbi:hypothetical protein M569_14668, partial [Genlisea aurea]